MCQGPYKVDKSLFYINGRHIFDYLAIMKTGKKPQSFGIPPIVIKNDKSLPHNPSVQERILRSKHHFEVIQYNKAHHIQRVAKNHASLSSNAIGGAISRYHMRYNSHEGNNPNDYVQSLDKYQQHDSNLTMQYEPASHIEQSKRMYEMQMQQ